MPRTAQRQDGRIVVISRPAEQLPAPLRDEPGQKPAMGVMDTPKILLADAEYLNRRSHASHVRKRVEDFER